MRRRSVTVRLTDEEYEWFRRHAHWEGEPMAGLLRDHVRRTAADAGYLRPPDDEPQDFGDEKAMMQWIVSLQAEQ